MSRRPPGQPPWPPNSYSRTFEPHYYTEERDASSYHDKYRDSRPQFHDQGNVPSYYQHQIPAAYHEPRGHRFQEPSEYRTPTGYYQPPLYRPTTPHPFEGYPGNRPSEPKPTSTSPPRRPRTPRPETRFAMNGKCHSCVLLCTQADMYLSSY